ncbi:HAMP domain-containing sensor histidine kinase [Pseudonocardia sp. EC080619-01]|uniref:sensor histidine kinase n=1 Tax=Pseudonocardia sp. EC080619-01 TaxID=1096856 RepID=UPI00143AE79D|nr:HAMP domain-containing sensor histidine kinase [Pseudonocardia sp. EC080619-01]
MPNYMIIDAAHGVRSTNPLAEVTAPLAAPVGPAAIVPRVDEVSSIALISSEDDVLANLAMFSVLSLTGLAVLSLLVGWLIVGRILSPVRRMTKATEQMLRDPTLRRALNDDGRDDEFSRLARTMDSMVSRIHASGDAHRRFAANASHELSTPLAATRTTIQVALEKPLDAEIRELLLTLLASNERSTATLAALLALTRAQDGLETSTNVEFSKTISDCLDAAEPEAQMRSVTIYRTLVRAPVHGDAELLTLLVDNLIRNSVRYNISGGRVDVHLATAYDEVRLTVVNTGELVNEADISRLTEPFQRGHSRTGAQGSGLGLSLVAAITEAHHGRLKITSGKSGGLSVTVSLFQPSRVCSRNGGSGVGGQ